MKENKAKELHTVQLPLDWKPRHRDDLIRLGARYDAGYVVTETAVRNTDFLIGLGIGRDWTFERDFYEKTGCPVHCYDHTVGLLRFLKPALGQFITSLLKPGAFNVHQILFPLKYKNFFSGEKKHYAEKVGTNPGNSSDFRKIFSRIPESGRVFIKMDIEGGEYRVLSSLRDYYARITGLVIEFHFMIFKYEVVDKHIAELKKHFDIVHVHANNCAGIDSSGTPMCIEMTFEHRAHYKGPDRESGREYPVEGLDFSNNIFYLDNKIEFIGSSAADLKIPLDRTGRY